ncbi:MAG: C39 family peptidase [Rhodospirillaceae bacterium]|nr:C39 family peptidase [Rhodospirillales bacterium]
MPARPIAALALVLAWAIPSAQAADATLAFSGGTYTVPVTSLREARFKTVIRQEHDFSCGSAALATLLTHHYGRTTSERDAFEAMYATGDQQAIQKFGFSLFDMQRYLASVGFRAEGYRVGLDKLAEVGVPAITLISTKGYNHFVVVKGVKDGDVLVGDPAMGLKAIPKAEFNAMWQGVMFVIHDGIEQGREHFNRTEEWAVRRKAPYGTALSRNGLATFSIALPGLFEF